MTSQLRLPLFDGQIQLFNQLSEAMLQFRIIAKNYSGAGNHNDIISRIKLVLIGAVHLSQAAACMAKEQVRRLPVVEGRRLVGMVSLGDLSHRDEYCMEAAEALSEITANVKML